MTACCCTKESWHNGFLIRSTVRGSKWQLIVVQPLVKHLILDECIINYLNNVLCRYMSYSSLYDNLDSNHCLPVQTAFIVRNVECTSHCRAGKAGTNFAISLPLSGAITVEGSCMTLHFKQFCSRVRSLEAGIRGLWLHDILDWPLAIEAEREFASQMCVEWYRSTGTLLP